MEHLSTLEKIYLYGETLSSEEMNLIIAYVNNTIDAVNTLIRNNNGINSGHCELRYKNDSSQPLKPTTGSNGLTNGWSNTYSLPNTSLGETAWMTICFVTGENVYGEWSTPVCISWGSVTGQQGPPGQAGIRGSFVSRIFKRANLKPDTPTGGTYDNPIPSGWYDGIPDGVAIIWSSTCTFYGNGTQSGWSEPALESDTTTLDIEFSPLTIQPSAPLGNNPFSNHEIEGWYDPSSPNFNSVGPMVWRAERKVSNGEYDGNWTITRIFGEKGELGLPGEAGGHYEFRYKNYKPTLEVPVPVKPSTGSEGRSNGWSDTLTTLSEMLLRDGIVTWMTQCFFDEHGYGTWSTPIRITGGNGIDGNDGTDHEFIYTRSTTDTTPYTPPTTQKSRTELFGNSGIWVEPNHNIAWTDDPQGVDDTYMWEFVSTRTKQGGLWLPWTTPVVWANWGKQGKIGPMSYLAGEWKSNVTYTKTAEKNPVVYHNNNYYYLKGEITTSNPSITSIGQSPTGTYTGNNTNPWALAENYEMLFTDILFVNKFAKLESFIISGDWMFSLSGTLWYRNGNHGEVYANHNYTGSNNVTYTVNTAYLLFDPSYPNVRTPSNVSVSTQHPDPNFVPDFAIDSLSGRCYFWKGKFTGDVVANSLSLGGDDMSSKISTIEDDVSNARTRLSTAETDISNAETRIGTIETGMGSLEVNNVSVSTNTPANGLKTKTITVTKGNTTETFTIIYEGDFLLTDIGTTGAGYFKVSKQGLLEAHNALIYGTVYASGGQFSGTVNATQFIAGDLGGLNITTTGDAISFNYGGERRAWFTTKDPDSGDNTNGMYLYIKGPNGNVITIDFANLLFRNATVTGSAIQLTNFYSSVTTANYQPSIFLNSSDGLYYSNSLLSLTLSGSYYRKDKSAQILIIDNSKYRLCFTDFFKYVTISSGSITSTSTDYYASTSHFESGQIIEVKSLGGTDNPTASNIYMGEGDITMSSLNMTIDNTSKYYAVKGSGPSTGDKYVTTITGFGTSFTIGENIKLV